MPPRPNRVPLIVRLQRAPAQFFQWLARLGAKLVSPIEWLVSTVVRSIFGAFEHVEGIEGWALSIGSALLWPVRMAWRLMAWLADAVLPKSLRNVLSAPFRGLANLGPWLGGLFVGLAEKLNLDGPLLKLAQWTKPLWYPFAAVGGFLSAWIATRPYKQLLWGLPTVLVLLPILLAMTWTKLWGSSRVASRYKVAVQQAVEKKEYDRAALFERKLAQLGVNTQLNDFNTAEALNRDGKIEEAFERMKLLAPEGRPGYPSAHFWIIQQLLSGKLEVSPEESHRLVGVHLKQLQALGARGTDIQILEAIWLTQENKVQEAIDLLKPLVGRVPQAAMMSMELNLRLGQISAARDDARTVRTHMEDRSRRAVPFTPQLLQSWVMAEELLGDRAKEQAVVREWLKADPENAAAKNLLAELCQHQFEQSIRVPNPDLDQLADLFVEASELTRNPKQLQMRVAKLYQLRSEVPEAKGVVERIMASPRTPAPILEAIGTVAASVGEVDEAKIYLKQAIDKAPKNAIAWNNYAWILLQGSDSKLGEALEAVNKALAIHPDEFRFRETRGQVLVRMKKWKEAVPDLEYAVNGMPDSVEIHQSLAAAYEALGETQLARVHRQQSQ